jgi:hypothetical protein
LVGEKIIADGGFAIDVTRRTKLTGDSGERGALDKQIPILGANGMVHNGLVFILVDG